MAGKPEKPSDDWIKARHYYWARLRQCRRLPAILKTGRKIRRIPKENRESWGSLLETAAQKYPDNPAVKSHDGILGYKAFNELVNRYCTYLMARGVKKGDKVVLMMGNRPDLLAVYSAVAKLGGVSVMINPNLDKDALLYCLTLNPVRTFIIGEEMVDTFETIRPDMIHNGGRYVFLVPAGERKPVPKGFTDIKAAIQGCPTGNPPTTRTVKPEDAIAHVFTPASPDGMPEASVITHGRLVKGAYFNGGIILDLKSEDTLYVPLPFFHPNALVLSWPCVLPTGSALAIRREFSADSFWSDVRHFNATVWCYTGDQCRSLLNQPQKPDDRNHTLTRIFGSGLPPDIWTEFKNRFGISRVFEMYGIPGSNLFFVNRFNLDKTIGTCTASHAIVKYDKEADTPVKNDKGFLQTVRVGETGLLLGEITESDPCPGFIGKDSAESRILHHVFRQGDAWLDTGVLLRDIGYGHARFAGRAGSEKTCEGRGRETEML